MNYGLGRLPLPHDARDWSPRKLMAMIEAGIAIPVHWQSSTVLMQGNTPHCVGFAGAGWKATDGANSPGDSTITDAEGHRLYYAAKAEEGIYPGDANIEEGSYSRSLAKALRREGTIDAYAIGGYDDLVEWCEKYGSVPVGTLWYESMRYPDSRGVVSIQGDAVAGGHEYLVHGVNLPLGDDILNSWSRGWGLNGGAFMVPPTLRRLIDQEGGDALFMVKLAKALAWPDLIGYEISAAEVDIPYEVREAGAMKGFPEPDGTITFRPGLTVTQRQVGTVLCNIGLQLSNPWKDKWTIPATREWVKAQFPQLVFLNEPVGPLKRFQLLMLIGRYLRERT